MLSICIASINGFRVNKINTVRSRLRFCVQDFVQKNYLRKLEVAEMFEYPNNIVLIRFAVLLGPMCRQEWQFK
jgi:hypothetical protein